MKTLFAFAAFVCALAFAAPAADAHYVSTWWNGAHCWPPNQGQWIFTQQGAKVCYPVGESTWQGYDPWQDEWYWS